MEMNIISNFSSTHIPEVEDLDVSENGNLVKKVFISLAFSIIIFLTVFGNLLVFLAVVCTRNLRKPTNYLVVNLAIADMSLGVSVLPFSAALEVLGHWPFGSTFCEIWAAIDVLYCTASINTLCVISIDRYIGVTRPLRYREMITGKHVLAMILTVWVVSFAVSIPALLGWRDHSSSELNSCDVNDQIGYVFFSVSVSFYIPTIIVIFIYWKIYQITRKSIDDMMQNMVFPHQTNQEVTSHLRKEDPVEYHQSVSELSLSSSDSSQSLSLSGSLTHDRSIKQNGVDEINRHNVLVQRRMRKFKMELKAAKTLAKVVGAFICCWFPFFFLLPFGKKRQFLYSCSLSLFYRVLIL